MQTKVNIGQHRDKQESEKIVPQLTTTSVQSDREREELFEKKEKLSPDSESRLQNSKGNGEPLAESLKDVRKTTDSIEGIPAHFSKTNESIVQRQVLQRALNVGIGSQDSVVILQELVRGDNTAAMRAVVTAIDQGVLSSGEEVHLVCRGGGEQFDLTITSEDATTMHSQLTHRIHLLASAARASSREGATPDTTVISQDALTEGFNREFAPILVSLREADHIMSGSEDEPRHEEFTTAELREMFSSLPQRERMLSYLHTHQVPDRLFNGDDAGNANAQQRILMSAHILTHGVIQRGSFTQRIHARFCGHWVHLVNSYAGVGTTGGRGIEHEFDHEGNPVMGSDPVACVYEGQRTQVEESERGEGQTHRLYSRAPLPVDRFGSIQPGDWLYVFTGTDTAGGDHSVIFSNWIGGYREVEGIHYRRAAVFSQTSPDRGGARDEWLLGDQAGRAEGHTVYPITRIARPDTGDSPPGTVSDVETADLGVRPGRSPWIERQNERFIRRHTPRGRRIDRNALNRFLQETNLRLLGQLESGGRTEPGQLLLWRETNRSDGLEVLVRLNERLNNLLSGVAMLHSTQEAESARVDPQREAARADAETRRTELEGELPQLDADIQRLNEAMGIGDSAAGLRAERTRLYRDDLRRLNHQLQHATGSRGAELREQRTQIIARRAALLQQISEVEGRRDVAIREAQAQEGQWRVGGGSTREHLRRLVARRERQQGEIQALDEAGGYHLAHPGRSQEFRGAETMRPVTGLLEHASPQPTWNQLLEQPSRSPDSVSGSSGSG